MKWLRWFLAGALAVPLAHQVMLALLNAAGLAQVHPYSLTPTKPFGIPQVISLSFWGGVWGVILGMVLLRAHSRRAWWVAATLFGAIAPTLVAAFVVAPLKGQHMHPTPKLAMVGLLVNGAWGFGSAALYTWMDRLRRHRT
jgi:hypothetical protein